MADQNKVWRLKGSDEESTFLIDGFPMPPSINFTVEYLYPGDAVRSYLSDPDTRPGCPDHINDQLFGRLETLEGQKRTVMKPIVVEKP